MKEKKQSSTLDSVPHRGGSGMTIQSTMPTYPLRKTLKNQQRHTHTQQTQADTQKKEQISTKPTKIL